MHKSEDLEVVGSILTGDNFLFCFSVNAGRIWYQDLAENRKLQKNSIANFVYVRKSSIAKTCTGSDSAIELAIPRQETVNRLLNRYILFLNPTFNRQTDKILH